MKSPCLEPGCAGFATYRGRCPDHSKQREQQIGRAGKEAYATKRWALTRRRKLTKDPICERCERELANTVHHRVDIAEGGDEYAMRNLESLCGPCHSRETRARQVVRT